MNIICPICSQTLNAAGVPTGTKVNCPSCRNNFMTPEYAEVLPVARHQKTNASASRESVEPTNFFSKITTFQGRIGRLQYFYGLLFKLGLIFGVGLITILSYSITNEMGGVAMIISAPLCIFAMWVNLSLQARRLHDMDRSGFWLLLYLVPIVNFVFALVIYISCLASEGSKKSNKYGTAPYLIFGHDHNEEDNNFETDHQSIKSKTISTVPKLTEKPNKNLFGGFPWNCEECGMNRFTCILAFILTPVIASILNTIVPFDGNTYGSFFYATLILTFIVVMRLYNAGWHSGWLALTGAVFFLSSGALCQYSKLDMSLIIGAGIVVLYLLSVCVFQKERLIPE
jgi:uncharacterized membrane protein YhaH (DUF805 family)